MLVSKTRDLSSILDGPALTDIKNITNTSAASGCVSINDCTLSYCFVKSRSSGYSSVRLECLLWEQEVVSSNLAIPTNWREQLSRRRDCLLSRSFG